VHKIVPVDADPVLAFFEGVLEQDGLTAPAALDPAADDDQPRKLESGDLEAQVYTAKTPSPTNKITRTRRTPR
jgi:hypothetical protein